MNLQRSLLTLCLTLCLAALPALASAGLFGGDELENEKKVVTFYREVERGGYKVVDTVELKKWMDGGKAMLIVDTMPYEASYAKGHLPGAAQFEFPIPEMTEMSADAQAKFEKLLGPDKDKVIVIYCGFPKCTRSHNGAMWAVKLGYTNVYRYPGGIKAWMESDYPVEKAN